MAVEKGKVLAAIETKFKGKSLTKNFKENIAAKWAEKIEKDDDIDAYIEDREDLILEASSEADRRAVAAAKKAKEEAAEAVNPDKGKEKKEEVKVDDDAPAWAKALIDQNKALSDKLTAFEAAGKAKTIADRFLQHEDVKGVNLPDSVKGRYVPQSDEELDAAIESFKTDFKPLVEANALAAYGNDKPAGSTDKKTPSTKTEEASDDEVKELLNDLK